jgi:hypothetical protein
MRTLLFALSLSLAAQSPQAQPQSGVPVKLTVTVEAKHGHDVPAIPRPDVMAHQDKTRIAVADWVPAQGPHAGLELFILIDDAADTSLGSQLNDLRQFILAQPASTRIGIAYMHNGIADVLENLTPDRARAAAALRLPLGNITEGAGPYLSLTDLIKKWPVSMERHEVVMVSAGADPLAGPPPTNLYLDRAIDDAQRAGTIVYAIYTPHAGHFGHSFWTLNWGQNYLARLAEETGGDSFMLGFGPPVSFAPYLAEISNRLEHQYIATLGMNPGTRAGFENVRLTTEVPNAELISAKRVYVHLGG